MRNTVLGRRIIKRQNVLRSRTLYQFLGFSIFSILPKARKNEKCKAKEFNFTQEDLKTQISLLKRIVNSPSKKDITCFLGSNQYPYSFIHHHAHHIFIFLDLRKVKTSPSPQHSSILRQTGCYLNCTHVTDVDLLKSSTTSSQQTVSYWPNLAGHQTL